MENQEKEPAAPENPQPIAAVAPPEWTTMPSRMAELSPAQNRAIIARKILMVMAEVQRVTKDAQNTFHNYRYTSDDAVVTALRQSMIRHGLAAISHQRIISAERGTTRNGDPDMLTTLTVDYTFVDAETGANWTVTYHGYGKDKEDKGVYKAATGAEKYFLLKEFWIPTGDDPEKDTRLPQGNQGGRQQYQRQQYQPRPAQRATPAGKPAGAPTAANAEQNGGAPPAAASQPPKPPALPTERVTMWPSQVGQIAAAGKAGIHWRITDTEGCTYWTWFENIARDLIKAAEQGQGMVVAFQRQEKDGRPFLKIIGCAVPKNGAAV